MKRLGHKKSRTGCQRCKQRRVKCDEAVPCGACMRHQVSCSLQPRTSMSGQQESTYGPALENNHGSGLENTASQEDNVASSCEPPSSDVASVRTPGEQSLVLKDPVPYFSNFLHGIQYGRVEEWTLDLELLHHYTVVAYRTFTFWGEVHHTLQYDVPREGLQHTFLLQQVLAFAGFHLAYVRANRRHFYSLHASQHQGRALSGMRAALTGGVTARNCHALYTSSIFLIICAFATFPNREVHNSAISPLDSLVDIFALTDGISLILKASDQYLREGPIKGLFAGKTGSVPISAHLQILVDRLLALEPRISSQSLDQDEEDTVIIKEAAESLVNCLLSVHGNNSLAASVELRAAFRWALRLPTRYLDLTRRRNPMAMVVLAHYCVVLHYAESTCWFFEGWARTVVDNIMGYLAGSPSREFIQWPLSVMELIVAGADESL
ncbi:hypothetical protein B0O99DRAFT_628147 [Bisporella sp. PMI_857]|nr:hypothetical protein B0O99DRAFT_628147 [Bisporella sp. PMI_857]